MKSILAFGLLILSTSLSAADYPGTTDVWNGYQRHVFQYEGRQCYVVEPNKEADGRPWIWRARFWGHRPEVDLALLDKGFHLAYMDVAEMLGNPQSVAHWNSFYKLLTEEHGLAKKPALEGMSRGGLYIYSWASANPGKVACVYADAPVCDIRSWPLALRAGKVDPGGWKMVVSAFGFQNEAEARQYKHNPIDLLGPLAKAGVPLLHVAGDADLVVPLEENTAVIEKRYKALGGDISVIIKNGIGHKHGLDDPAPIIQFILKHTLPDPITVVPPFQDGDVVTFIGDSITHSRKWHKYVSDYYLTRFPEKHIRFLNAGLSGDSAGGAVRRLEYDILPGKPNVAVIMLGMNDVSRNLYEEGATGEANLAARRKALDQYKVNMTRLVDKLSQSGIKRFVFVTSSPFDDTARLATPNLPGVNDALRQTRTMLHELAVRTTGLLVDFQAPMTEMNLQQQKKDPAYTLIGSDRVHPLDPGMLVMAYLFLKSQDAPAIVSRITVPAKDGTGECIRCQISAVTRTDGTWAFDVRENSLPFPVEESSKAALALVPIEAQLNQQILTLAAAPTGRYRLLIDAKQIDEYPAEAIRRGVNLAFDARTPQYVQAQEISAMNEERRKLEVSLRDVVKVEETIIKRPGASLDDPKVSESFTVFVDKLNQTNASSLAYYSGLIERYYKLKPAVAEMQKQIKALTERLREISQPVPHHFELQFIATP